MNTDKKEGKYSRPKDSRIIWGHSTERLVELAGD